MSSSYPRHVTGAGSAYYSYRPICKIIEKGVRKTFRENASIPKDFQQLDCNIVTSADRDALHRYSTDASTCRASRAASEALLRCSIARHSNQLPRRWLYNEIEAPIYSSSRAARRRAMDRYMFTASKLYEDLPKMIDWDEAARASADRQSLSRYSAEASACRASRIASEALQRCARARSEMPYSRWMYDEIEAPLYSSSRAARARSLARYMVTSEASRNDAASKSIEGRKVANFVEKQETGEKYNRAGHDALSRYQRARSESLSRFSRAMSPSPWRYIKAEDAASDQILAAKADALYRFSRSRSQTPCRFTRAESEARESLSKERSQSMERRLVRSRSVTPRRFSRQECVTTLCLPSMRKSDLTSRFLVRSDSAADAIATGSLYERLGGRHPYRLPEEDEYYPPHPESYWPVNRRHFDLVSSYDLMTDYLGITKAGQRNAIESC